MSTAPGYRMTPRLRSELTRVLSDQHGWSDEHALAALHAVEASTDGDPVPDTNEVTARPDPIRDAVDHYGLRRLARVADVDTRAYVAEFDEYPEGFGWWRFIGHERLGNVTATHHQEVRADFAEAITHLEPRYDWTLLD